MSIFRTIFCLCCALFFCQLPSFSKQYSLRLEAHYLEIKRVKKSFSQSVGARMDKKNSKIKGEYDKFLQERYGKFKNAKKQLATADPILQPVWMFFCFDFEIAKETWKGFSLSFFFTFASVVWALLGALFGELLLFFIKRLFRQRA